MVEEPRTLGELVRVRRERAGLTQQVLAERAGMSVRALRNIEQNRTNYPHTSSLHRLSVVLGARLARPDPPASHEARTGGLSIGVLGPLSVHRGGTAVALPSTRQRLLLALLALQPGQSVPADAIVDVLWGEHPPRTCRSLVHTHVARLRRLLEPDRVIAATRGGYRLDHDPAWVDLARFEELAAHAGRYQAAGNREIAAGLLAEALDCWRGPVLADLGGRLVQHPAAVAAAQRRLDCAVAYADAGLTMGRAGPVVERLRPLTVDSPLHEALHARLMLALAGAGQQAAALAVFADLRARLADELGVEPGPELRAAHVRVLRQEVPSAAPVPALRATAPAPSTAPAGPAQLLADVPSFVGRADHLKHLDELAGSAHDGAATVIAAVTGCAGVGKTTLAVHWAHRVRDRFPDGQLYVNLRGFEPAGSPMPAAEAVRGFLDALSVAPDRVPAGLAAQSALYRSLLAGRRMLVVLDNASDAAQVRPLLPGAAGCLVVVTSRDDLTGLIADGAYPVGLDVLTDEESANLLGARVGVDRVAAEPGAVDEIVARCAGLPLALAIVAARAAQHRHFPLAAFAAELRTNAFAGTDLEPVFSWSYRGLGEPAARLFRLVGAHPGPDLAAPAAASLAGVAPARVRPLLAELSRAHLLDERAPGRFSCHDLLRAYGAGLAGAAERRDAVRRLLDHYLHGAVAAAVALDPHREQVRPPPAEPGVATVAIAGPAEALAWFGAEHRNLVAAVELAAAAGFDRHCWQLGSSTWKYFDRRGNWHDWAVTLETALAATERLGDRAAQARIARGLAGAFSRLGRLDDAFANYRRAIVLLDELGDRAGHAHTLHNLAIVLHRQGDDRAALEHTRQALELFRAAGYRYGEATALGAIGWYQARLGDHEAAVGSCRAAVALHRAIGDRVGAAASLDSLGFAYHRAGALPRALACYRDALDLIRETGDRSLEADTLLRIGDIHEVAGDRTAARTAWREALSIMEELGQPGTEQARARLHTAG